MEIIEKHPTIMGKTDHNSHIAILGLAPSGGNGMVHHHESPSVSFNSLGFSFLFLITIRFLQLWNFHGYICSTLGDNDHQKSKFIIV